MTMTASEQAQFIEDMYIHSRVRLNITHSVYTLSLQRVSDNLWVDVSNTVYTTRDLIVQVESGDFSIIEE